MADFIAPDDEEFEDVVEDRQEKRRRKKPKPVMYRLDEEDREVIKENTGIELKPKNRLKRNAEKVSGEGPSQSSSGALVKKEIEVKQSAAETVLIDTSKKQRRAEYKDELRREQYDYMRERNLDRQMENADKLRQAQEIFGEDDDELDLPKPTVDDADQDMPIESMFNADEIDDPFSTPLDK